MICWPQVTQHIHCTVHPVYFNAFRADIHFLCSLTHILSRIQPISHFYPHNTPSLTSPLGARFATGLAITFAYPLMFAGLKSSMFSLIDASMSKGNTTPTIPTLSSLSEPFLLLTKSNPLLTNMVTT